MASMPLKQDRALRELRVIAGGSQHVLAKAWKAARKEAANEGRAFTKQDIIDKIKSLSPQPAE